MLYYPCSYTILAPTAVPKGFLDAKQVTEKVINAIRDSNGIEEGEYRFGHTKACYSNFDLFFSLADFILK